MKMLQIRLRSVQSIEGASGGKTVPVETVTVACPDHLILADLPVAKGLGSATATSLVKTIGRRSRRQLGERVHFCVRCDFPIAIYGRLSPCDHAFCLDCARSDSICYLCDERIQKIQTIKMMDGIFICAAPHCLKSFLKKNEFESHIYGTHADLLQRNTDKEEGANDSEAASAKQSTATESTARAPPRQVFSPRDSQPRDTQPPPRSIMQPKQPQFFGQVQNLPETPFTDYPLMQGSHPPLPNFQVPVSSNSVVGPPPFGYAPFPPEGGLPFYGGSYEMARPESAPEVGAEQGSLLGFPPGPVVAANFSDGFPRPWIMGPTGQGMVDAFQVRPMFFQGDYGQNMGVLASNMAPPSMNMVVEPVQSGSGVDPRDGKGILAPQPIPFPPLPPPPGPPHLMQHNRDKSYSDHDMGRDGREFGWQQQELHESFGTGQDQ